MGHIRYLTLFILFNFLMGCVTLEHRTLPASKEEIYSFPSYTVRPPQSVEWRFLDKNSDLQRLTLLHKDYRAVLFFWIMPVLMEVAGEDREESIVDYFQNKELEKFKLSPDILLTDKSVARSNVSINDRTFNMITIDYEIEENAYAFTIYYHVSEKADVLYSIAVIKPLFLNRGKTGWEDDLRKGVEGIIAGMAFLSPDREDIQELRVTYAHSDFIESAKDKYLKKQAGKVQKKFDIAVREANKWIEFKSDNYRAYEYLGILASYNSKFEHYGDGFDMEETEKQLLRSLEIRPYYKSAQLNLAKLYEHIGRKDDAIKAYMAAVKLSPNDEDVYYKLGQLYEELEQRDKAREYYEKAIRYWSSGFATRDELKKKLEKWDE